jgi:hypothetical protein
MNLFKPLSFAVSRIGLFWQEKINSLFFRWTLFFVLVQFGMILMKFSSLPPQIPLYYSQPWGEVQLASASSIIILPVASVLVLIINNILAVFFLNSVQLLSRLLIVGSLAFSFFSTIATYQIISLIS